MPAPTRALDRAPARVAAGVAAGVLLTATFALAACATPRSDGGGAESAAVGAPGAAGGSPAARQPEAAVTLTVDRTSYAAGATVQLRLVNGSATTYGYNACTRTVEQRQGGGWAVVPDDGRICTRELRLLAPRDSASDRTELPRDLVAGEYRLVVSLGPQDQPDGAPTAPVRATSPAFRVE